MQFVHENLILRLGVPEIRDGMAYARMALFLRLARFAHAQGHPYWGYRFTAWALHYLEDISQPYHARATPHAGLLYYLKFLFSGEKTRMKREATRIVHNRHYLYEDYAEVALESDARLKDALSSPADDVRSDDDYTLFMQVAFDASAHASAIDQDVSRAFGPRFDDPSYDYENDPTFRIREAMLAMRRDVAEQLLNHSARRLIVTGQATRTLLRLSRGGAY
jgi:hypothetical protein